MKLLLFTALGLTSLTSHAAALYVECALSIEDHVGEKVSIVEFQEQHKLFPEPLPKNISFQLRTEHAVGNYSWNVGFYPSLNLENRALGIKTMTTDGGWLLYFDKTTENPANFRRTKIECKADA